MPDVVSLIHVKRDNTRPLTDREIGWLFAAYASGEVADEQMAALLMAVYFNGLDGAELRAWTGEMIASGERLNLTAPPPAGPAPRSTSTPPAASATRSRWFWRRWWRAAARWCRCCPGAA